MSELGDVLEAMNVAPRGFDVLLGEAVTWSDMDVVRRAMDQRSGSTASAVLSVGVAGPAPAGRPITRLWLARDGRYRAEHQWGVNVFDGADLWVQHGEQVTRHSSHPDPVSSLPCALLVRASSLLGLAPFTAAGQSRVAGHDAVVLECSPDSSLRMPMAGMSLLAADRVRIEVDPRTGVLLLVRSWFEGQPAMEMGFEALEYDVPLAHDPFRYDLDPSTEVRTERDIRRQMLDDMGVDPADVDLDDDDAVHEAFRSHRGARAVHFVAPLGPTPSMSLADRYLAMGPLPEDMDAAHAAVVETIQHVSDVDDAGGLVNVQGGSNLGDAVREAGARVRMDGHATYEVDEVVFVRADEAVVAFRVMVPIMSGGYPQTGRVLKIGDRWLVERATMCNLIGAAGVRCPPPPAEP